MADKSDLLAFKVTSKSSFWKGPLSVSVTAQSRSGPSYFVDFEHSRTLVFHRGMNNSGPVIGRVQVPKWRSPKRLKYQLPMSLSNGDMAFEKATVSTRLSAEQEFACSGWFNVIYSTDLPAVAAALGAQSSLCSWSQTSKYGSFWRGYGYLLFEGDKKGGREIAVYINKNDSSGELQLLRPGLDELALEQIVVSCIAFTDMQRRDRQAQDSADAAGNVGSAVASVAAA